MDGDWKNNGGSGTIKLAMPSIQNSINSYQSIKSSLSSQKSLKQDSRDRGGGQVSAVPEAEFTLEIKENTLSGAKSPLSLEVSLSLERGLTGKWEIKSSNIKEVGCASPSGVGPTQAIFRPNALAEAFPLNPPHVHKFKPKPLWSGNPKEKN